MHLIKYHQSLTAKILAIANIAVSTQLPVLSSETRNSPSLPKEVAPKEVAQNSTLSTPLRVVVNSNQDGPIQADDILTLREAIEIANGTLPLERLSPAERAQVQPLPPGNPQNAALPRSRIEFNLPAGSTTIRLVDMLPPLAAPGLIVDGTTQPGYDPARSATAEISIPIPVVAITPDRSALNKEVFRGLTVVADGVTIRGLALYGFTSHLTATAGTLPADILIAHRNPPPNTSQQQPQPPSFFPFRSDRDVPPKDVVIEDNWLGILPDGSMPPITSAFGVSVFNSFGTTIRRNRIASHDSSGIITSVQANNLLVTENIIVGNGIAGMPDAIRLEGVIDKSQINGNLICGNDGSGVYLFKPEGTVQIRDNRITYNGRRLRRAAVYLMGNDHLVVGNEISNQAGAGVVVAAYPKSDRDLIQKNRFSALEGLSIDLVGQNNAGVLEYQNGDGPNPPRNSKNRRQDTANGSINAPQFISSEFFALGNKTTLYGTADPGAQVEIYRAEGVAQGRRGASTPLTFWPGYTPLKDDLTTVKADEQGKFSVTLDNLLVGDRVSAIATDSKYGTSEPAPIALIRSTDGTSPPDPTGGLGQRAIPQCTTTPTPPSQPPQSPPLLEPIRIQVPTNVHFALDKATISPASARILDRIATVMRENPAIVAEIRGHADPRASDAYNLDLSKRRAIAARNYLLRRGIGSERMTIRALGESQPLTPGRSILDYARDRRVEFVFKDARGIELIVQEEDLQLEK